MLKIFKGYQAFLLLLIPFVGFMLWLNTFFVDQVEINGRYVFMPLSQVMFKVFGFNTFISKVVAYLLLLFNSFLLVRLNIRYNFMRARSYLPAIVYILLLSFVSDIQRLTPALIASLFIILAINKLMSTFKKEKLAIQIMDASLLISVASLFYFPAFFLIFLVWIGMVLIRPFRWREWVFTLFGMATPYLILAGIKYIQGASLKIPFRALTNENFILHWSPDKNMLTLIFFSYLLLLILLASFQVMKLFGTKKIHSRRFYVFFLWLFIISLAIFFIVPSTTVEVYYICAIPLTFLLSHYFIHLENEWIAELFFLVLCALIVVNKLTIPL